MRSALLEILEELHPDQEFEGINTLVTDKVLDSFDIITLISEINDTFDVVVSADKIIPENFNSVDALCELIRSLLDED
ncbi:MAG: acyl carrier protein [Lachnospiraceae bacterium]|nr:acyl carrier protein [Lachnospiraceae bacterium]MCI9150057.1 acyl carrier protein [Lachnospiraceae bacterium]